MEAYYYSTSDSSFSSSKSMVESKRVVKPAYPFQPHSMLHSVKKSQSKPWRNKLHVAPMPPRPVKVYEVDAVNFRELVQQLTGARAMEQFMKPPQSVARAETETIFTNSSNSNFAAEAEVCTNNNNDDDSWYSNRGFQDDGLMGRSPPYYSNLWCNFPPISPGILSSLESSRILLGLASKIDCVDS
ncbi:uncharacterized protein LOC107481744 [Arachis duranensis]|uniref:Uncharacterized protein LOC107481744 n=1 Tax=Arachis duranensis TaxID=130453 RepID=A0A6P4CVY9_ARADU|nr:uncharacterized protein LOC107481744 [Arachis duranensis]